jgi:hypothetical protein
LASNVCSKTDGVGTPSDQPALPHSNILTEKNPPPPASVIGTDDFSYSNGNLAKNNGGSERLLIAQ